MKSNPIYRSLDDAIKGYVAEHKPVLDTSTSLKHYAIRAADISLSLAGLVVSAPILAWAAYKIKKEDRGPILFTQERYGLDGNPFTVYKLRTMPENHDAVGNGKRNGELFRDVCHSQRTTIGSKLAERHYDELPQFYNVLRGDMSLFGPRPLDNHTFEDNFMNGSLDQLAYRLLAKPGMTGSAQIDPRSTKGLDAATRRELEGIDETAYLTGNGLLGLYTSTLVKTGYLFSKQIASTSVKKFKSVARSLTGVAATGKDTLVDIIVPESVE